MSRFLVKAFLWIFWGSIMGLTACVPYKQFPYLQNPGTTAYPPYPTSEYRLRPSDILHVDLKTLEENSTDFFQNTNQQMMQAGQQGAAMFYFQGYIVSDSGSIDLPLIGQQKVGGLTVREVQTLLEGKLNNYIKFAKVNVKLANFRVSVMGEVMRPGVQYAFEQKHTLLQALSNAGDLTTYANRKKVRIIRETPTGTQMTEIDLTKPETVSADFYYLQPNDVIYVEPLKARVYAPNVAPVSLALSSISVILVIVNLLIRN